MTALLEWTSGLLLLAGAGFYCAGTVGLLRFPDVYARLHALTPEQEQGRRNGGVVDLECAGKVQLQPTKIKIAEPEIEMLA
mgnify:CR=1 FL=1